MILPANQEEHPPGTPRMPPNGGGVEAPPDRIAFELAASGASASIARERVDGWLRALAWPQREREDIVLVVNEAISNSIEHGYGVRMDDAGNSPGTISIGARVELLSAHRRQVVLLVCDYGTWKVPSGARFRGHGLAIMHECGADVRVIGSDEGTTVVFTSHAVPGRRRAT